MPDGDGSNDERRNGHDPPQLVRVLGFITGEYVLAFIDVPSDEDTLTWLHRISGTSMYAWSGRALAQALGYQRWSAFQGVLLCARQVCRTAGQRVDTHFQDVVCRSTTRRGTRTMPDVQLSPHACYLLILCASMRKKPVAQARAYLATMTFYDAGSRRSTVNDATLDVMVGDMCMEVCANTTPCIAQLCRIILKNRLQREHFLNARTRARILRELTHLLGPFVSPDPKSPPHPL